MRQDLRNAERIIVKVGTAVVTHDGNRLALGRLFGIVEDVATLRKEGRQMLVVSSGAVGMGMRALGLNDRPASLGLRQACAAVGQGHLMGLYTQAFQQLGTVAAQVLLTQEDLGDRDRALCVRTTLMRLLELGVVPILNENDSVSVRELIERRPEGDGRPRPFGDNDGLSARVAVSLNADLLILLTNVDGLYTANPHDDPTAQHIKHVADVAQLDQAIVGGTSSLGTGGMASKVDAARIALDAGATVVIASGAEPRVVQRIVAGEDVGTLLTPSQRRRARHRHIAVGAESCGAILVNAGALEALTERKASLLPIGVVGIEGHFQAGDIIEIRDTDGRVHGRGLVNYDAPTCRRLAGHHTSDIDSILGWRGYNAIVTRTNIVMGQV